ncbi:MAG: hypothetical protein ACOC2L_05335 [Candidatus Sumerlaeota bacterium]
MPRKHISSIRMKDLRPLMVITVICCIAVLGIPGAWAQGNPFSRAAQDLGNVNRNAQPMNDPMDPMGDMDPMDMDDMGPEALTYPGGELTEEEFNSLTDEEKRDYIIDTTGGVEGMPDEPTYEIPTLTINLTPAYMGRRVEDAFINRRTPNEPLILDDVQPIEITDDEIPLFSDDGRTLGDWVADDGIYSNIQPPSTNEYMGADSFYSLTRTMNVLTASQQMNVLDFFGLNVVTTERFSSIPKLRDRIEERDQKIYRVNEAGQASGWVDSFLADYRENAEDVRSSFFPLYVPRPPHPPAIPPPPSPWRPAGYEPTPLEQAIDRYMAQVQPEQEGGEVDLQAVREELMLQLEDDEFLEQFMEQYGPREEGEEGEEGGPRGEDEDRYREENRIEGTGSQYYDASRM